ncbi:MAG TPA: hypothetical protein VHO29_20300 [Marmoricola sp.]|nr:hypothetical protein [Marmoricola sp.]
MTRAVFVDKHVLQATADALTDLARDLPALLSAADGLGVGAEVAQLRAAPTWASETAVDLRARIGLVERLQQGNTTFTSFTVPAEELRQLAGGSMPVVEQLYALEAVQQLRDHSGLLDWDGSNFSDWIEKVEARALAGCRLLDGRGELIPSGVVAVDNLHLGGQRTLYAPGTTVPWLKAQTVTDILESQTFDEALAAARTATVVGCNGERSTDWAGKAEMTGDVQDLASHGSLTAAMLAPSPITWGSVAVTGVVDGGVGLVDHWDDVADAVGNAAERSGDTVGDTLGDGLEAVKDSKRNPGNGF